jgi:RNA polymerase primary sigma factor
MAPTDVTAAIRNAGRYISLDAPLVQGEEENMYDVLLNEDASNPDKELLMDSLKEEIHRALKTLTLREADIIRLYFGVNGKHTHTLGEIGEEFNLTRERVRQIKEKAIRRLKHTTRCRILKTYLV